MAYARPEIVSGVTRLTKAFFDNLFDGIDAANAATVAVAATPEKFPGIDPTGTSDSTAGIQAAVAATPNGGTLIIPPGEYRVSATITNGGKSLLVSAYGARFTNYGTGSVFSLSGGYESTIAVSSLVEGTVQETENSLPAVILTVANAPAWKKGDAVKLVSDDIIPGGRPETGASQRRLGQYFTVHESSGTTITLMGALDDPMATNLRVARFRDIRCGLLGATGTLRPDRVMPPASVEITAVAANALTMAAERSLFAGQPVQFSGASVPAGLTAGTTYYAIPVSPAAFRVATSAANAEAGTAVTISDQTASMTALFRTWNANTVFAFTGLRNLYVRDLVVENSGGAAVAFNGCYGGSLHNLDVRFAYDNVNTGSFGYGVLASCSTDVTVFDYRAARVRHAYTDDSSQIVAGSTNLHQYGRTKNCGVIRGTARDTSSTAWDTHHNGIGGFFIDSYAENCPVGAAFRGRQHRIKDLRVKNVKVAFKFFTEADGGESWGHEVDGVTGTAKAGFQANIHPVGHPNAGVREMRPSWIRNVDLSGLSSYGTEINNAVMHLERVKLRYASVLVNFSRLNDWTNSEIRTYDDIEQDLSALEAASAGNLRIHRSTPSLGATMSVRGRTILIRGSSTVFSDKVSYIWEIDSLTGIDTTDVRVDYPPSAHLSTNPATYSVLEYQNIYGNSDNSEWVSATDTTITSSAISSAIRQTRAPAVVLSCAPASDRILVNLNDGRRRGQILHIRNSGTANLTVRHGATAKTVLLGATDKVLAPGQMMTLLFIAGVGWCQSAAVV
ncbi:minor tail protein [Gordonia phage BiggityBass]|nr:minor tail protein [Gordonia phage BiggityBass]